MSLSFTRISYVSVNWLSIGKKKTVICANNVIVKNRLIAICKSLLFLGMKHIKVKKTTKLKKQKKNIMNITSFYQTEIIDLIIFSLEYRAMRIINCAFKFLKQINIRRNRTKMIIFN